MNRSKPLTLGSFLGSPATRILFLSGLVFCVFFIAEHNPKISTTENFVTDIEQQESWAAGGNPLRRIGFLSCAVFGFVGLSIGRWNNFRWNLPLTLLFVYLMWAGASISWSIDPGASTRRYILMLCCVIGCFGITRFFSLEQVVLAAIIVPLAYLVIGVGAEIFFGTFRPHVAGYRFAGTIHPNLQAANLAMLSLAAFVMAHIRPKSRTFYYGIMCVALFFLILTKSRTATAVLPLSLMVIWFVLQPPKTIVIGTLAGSCFCSIVAFGLLVVGIDPVSEYSNVLLMGRGEETGATLTGRIPLWQDLYNYIIQRPVQGFGFGAFWTPEHIYEISLGQQWAVSEAHSSYVDTAIQTGIIGTILVVSTAVTTFFYILGIYRLTREPAYLFILGGIVFSLIRGFTESGLSGPISFTSFLFVAVACHSWNAPDSNRRGIEKAVSNNPSNFFGVNHGQT